MYVLMIGANKLHHFQLVANLGYIYVEIMIKILA